MTGEPLPQSIVRPDRTLTISTGSRLHFGLLEVCPGEPHRFGGVGLMVASPKATLTLPLEWTEFSAVTISDDSCWLPRLRSVCLEWMDRHSEKRVPFRAIELEIGSMPHVGLGSGTQVQCLMAAALYLCLHSKLPSLSELTQLSKRGLRSHIGLTGFLQGGLVVDYGNDAHHHPRTVSHLFPPSWRILMVRDPELLGDNGPQELHMFEQCSNIPNPSRDEMLRLLDEQIIPSALHTEWSEWDRSIGVYGRFAGAVFSKAQGGIFRSASIERIVEKAKGLGVHGAAQSSWGPTVAIVAQDDDHADWLRQQIASEMPQMECEVAVPSNGPAPYRFGSTDDPIQDG